MISENSSPNAKPADTDVTDLETLTERIKDLARNGSFREAELLREQLMETSPMALDSIVSSAEVIEEEKTKRLDPNHISTWSELYDQLSGEQTNCLFYSLKRVKVESGKLLFAQGRPNNRLFFAGKR